MHCNGRKRHVCFTVSVSASPPPRRRAPPQPLRLFARARPLHVDTTGAAATADTTGAGSAIPLPTADLPGSVPTRLAGRGFGSIYRSFYDFAPGVSAIAPSVVSFLIKPSDPRINEPMREVRLVWCCYAVTRHVVTWAHGVVPVGFAARPTSITRCQGMAIKAMVCNNMATVCRRR